MIKGWTLAWPWLETAEFFMSIGSGRLMGGAARVAYRELVRWMAADFGFDELDANLLLTQCGRPRPGIGPRCPRVELLPRPA